MFVRDQTDESTIYINIPAIVNIDNMELNEEHLEAVADVKSRINDFLFYLCPSLNR